MVIDTVKHEPEYGFDIAGAWTLWSPDAVKHERH